MMDQAGWSLVRLVRWVAIVWVAVVAVGALAVVVVVNAAGLSFFSVSGDSMEPTLRSGQSVVLHQQRYIGAGQVVFFTKPSAWSDYAVGAHTTLVKHVVAAPGDTVTFDGKVFAVNGREVFDVASSGYQCTAGQVGYSHVLSDTQIMVMGDNAAVSLDSRRIFCDGKADTMFIPYRNVVGYGNVVATL